MRLAIVLLLTIAGIHYLDNPIATMYAPEQQAYAAKAWEYILTGLGGVVVLACCGVLARKRSDAPLLLLIIAWGMVESGERAVCRLARPIGDQVPIVDLFTGLCGVPFYWMGIAALALLAARIAKGTK